MDECPQALSEFLRLKGISFASVDIRGDFQVMLTTWPGFFIPIDFHVDIQRHFRVAGRERKGNGMAALANALLQFLLAHEGRLPRDTTRLVGGVPT